MNGSQQWRGDQCSTSTSFRTWLEGLKAAAKARGGRSLPFIPGPKGDLMWTGNHKIRGRETGELFNVRTGEFIKGCLSVAKLAAQSGTTSNTLYNHLDALGLMHSVLDWKDVPMLSQSLLRRPQYFNRHRLTPMAVEESFGITIVARDGRPLDLITPDGQSFIRSNPGVPSGSTIGDQVERVFGATPWLSHRSIAKKLGCDQATVSRHMKRLSLVKLRNAA